MKLSIGIITCRQHPCIGWFINSIRNNIRSDDDIEFIVVSEDFPEGLKVFGGIPVSFIMPKPCNWSGRHRITSENHWSKPNSINTFFCHAIYDHVLLVDDRSIAERGFMDAVREAHEGGYAMCGPYEKRINMNIVGGIAADIGVLTGSDDRELHVKKIGAPNPFTCPGSWFYGCVNFMPLEFALLVNGSPETWCNGLGMEDCVLGTLFENNGFPIRYDLRARLIEDRTPAFFGTPMKRTSFEKHPNDTGDKAHEVLRIIKTRKQSDNPFDLRKLRELIQSGGSHPLPPKDEIEWFTKQPLATL